MKKTILNNRAKSFVVIMITIAIVALFLRFAIEKIIDISIEQNESQATQVLKLISAALENYADNNSHIYPKDLSELTKTNPPYLDEEYTAEGIINGYRFGCPRMQASGYSCSAMPLRCNVSGRNVYNVTTGGILVSEKCERKE
jgi:hypothetical protein